MLNSSVNSTYNGPFPFRCSSTRNISQRYHPVIGDIMVIPNFSVSHTTEIMRFVFHFLKDLPIEHYKVRKTWMQVPMWKWGTIAAA